MKSTDESGIERTHRGNITEDGTLCSSKTEDFFWNETLLLLGKFEQFWPSTKSGVVVARASDSTAKATCTMRMCELAMSRRSWHRSSPLSTWTRMEVDDGQRDEQDESADQLEELRRVLAALSARRTGEAETFSNESCCVRFLVRGVCESERKRSTASETDEQGIGKARTIRTQNLLSFLLHVRGRSFDANVCVEIQQIREDGCHSVGTERVDAVRSEVLCRLHSANWSSNVHQQE